MKKNIKLVLILLIGYFCLCESNVNAKTLEVGDLFTVKQNGRITTSGLSTTYSKSAFGESLYYAQNSSGDAYYSYCEDPFFGNGKKYKVSRILADTTNTSANSERIIALDLAQIEVIKNGYNKNNTSFKFVANGQNMELSGVDLYAATNIASRALTYGVWNTNLSINKEDKNYKEKSQKSSLYVKRGIEWAANYSKEKLNKISPSYCNSSDLTKFKSCYTNHIIGQGNSWYNSKVDFKVTENTQGSKIYYAAQALFTVGLERGYQYLTGNVSIASINDEASSSASDKETVGENIEEYYYQTVEFKDFNKETGKIQDFSLTCMNCAQNNINLGSIEIYNPSTKEYEEYKSGVNALNYFKSDKATLSGKIKLRFKTTRLKDNENCKSVEYNIKYNYFDPTLEYIGAVLDAIGETNKQRFYIIQKNDGNLTKTITGKIKCAIACDTQIELPVCSTNEEESTATITSSTKIKTCIINNADEAGNSYQLTTENGGVDNDYCEVYCKEDYAEIKLNPIIKNVKCGGYFKLTSKIKGSKTCYTGGDTTDKRINKEKYLTDIKEVQEKLVDAMNRYYKYTAMNAYEKTSSSTSKTCGGSSCGSRETITVTWESYSKVAFTWSNENGSVRYITENGGSNSWSDSCHCSKCGTPVSEGGTGTYSCCGGCNSNASSSFNSWKKDVESNLSKAKSDLTKYTKEYQKIISDYNACTTGWTNEYAFAQKVKYYYDENRGEDNKNYSPYFDLLKGKDNLQYLETYGKEEVEYSISINKGETNDAYESGTWITINNNDNKAEKTKSDEYNYNSAYSEAFDTKNYVKCTTSGGCVVEKREISTATFVKKEVTKTQKYITPTAFYQIAANGKVIAYDSKYSFDKVQLEELKNKLPVSTSSVGGGVFKLMLEDLGEFYSEKNKYGRLIDNDNTSKSVVINTINPKSFKNGEYVCYYENNCRPKNCPDCEFICEGDGCSWKQCPDCIFTCENCIFNLDKLNIMAKTITTTNVKAANRNYGYNWVTSSKLESLQLLNQKASKTITEIEEVNEMVYSDKTTDGSTLGFSIVLTPEIIEKITNYNDKNEENGGYINDSLTCYDATVGGDTYKNIYCYSDLIDELVKENSENITVLPSRINDTAKRGSESQKSGYWTLWSDYTYSESVIGGPSWK